MELVGIQKGTDCIYFFWVIWSKIVTPWELVQLRVGGSYVIICNIMFQFEGY